MQHCPLAHTHTTTHSPSPNPSVTRFAGQCFLLSSFSLLFQLFRDSTVFHRCRNPAYAFLPDNFVCLCERACVRVFACVHAVLQCAHTYKHTCTIIIMGYRCCAALRRSATQSKGRRTQAVQRHWPDASHTVTRVRSASGIAPCSIDMPVHTEQVHAHMSAFTQHRCMHTHLYMRIHSGGVFLRAHVCTCAHACAIVRVYVCAMAEESFPSQSTHSVCTWFSRRCHV